MCDRALSRTAKLTSVTPEKSILQGTTHALSWELVYISSAVRHSRSPLWLPLTDFCKTTKTVHLIKKKNQICMPLQIYQEAQANRRQILERIRALSLFLTQDHIVKSSILGTTLGVKSLPMLWFPELHPHLQIFFWKLEGRDLEGGDAKRTWISAHNVAWYTGGHELPL